MSTKTPVISILVPVYNVEAYLQRCIDSVLAQDFTDWEMILVDDGSPDRCPEICDEAARKDARIRVVHKENGGLPSARLAGFEQAKGEYLVFLDSDDYLLPNALGILYQAIISDGGYDVARAMIQRCDSHGHEWLEHYEIEEGCVTSNQNFVEALYQGKMAPYIHSGMYKRSLFSAEVFGVLIDNNLSIGEDAIMTTIIAPNINRLKFINCPVSVYYLNDESMINTVVRSLGYNQRIRDVLRPYRTISDTMEAELASMAVLEDMKSFFTPELPFDWNFYKKNKEEFPQLRKSIYNTHPARYFFFIEHPMCYYIFTRCFCFLYRWIKLKGHRRKIIL